MFFNMLIGFIYFIECLLVNIVMVFCYFFLKGSFEMENIDRRIF